MGKIETTELRMHGWRSQPVSTRLGELAEVTVKASPGFPDRLLMVADTLLDVNNAIQNLILLEPFDQLPPIWQTVLQSLRKTGTKVIEKKLDPVKSGGGLAACGKVSFKPKGDGSLQLLRPATCGTAAHEVAAWLSTLKHPKQTVIIGPDSILRFIVSTCPPQAQASRCTIMPCCKSYPSPLPWPGTLRTPRGRWNC